MESNFSGHFTERKNTRFLFEKQIMGLQTVEAKYYQKVKHELGYFFWKTQYPKNSDNFPQNSDNFSEKLRYFSWKLSFSDFSREGERRRCAPLKKPGKYYQPWQKQKEFFAWVIAGVERSMKKVDENGYSWAQEWFEMKVQTVEPKY